MAAAKKKRARKPKGPPKTRWEKSADLENARRWNRAPLFVHAGLVPLATPAERQVVIERHRTLAEQGHEERQRAEAARGVELREKVRALVSPEKFAELEAQRHFPNDAGFYDRVLRQIEGRDKPPVIERPVRRLPMAPVQVPLFVGVTADLDTPAVVEGRAVPIEVIAAEHGLVVVAPGDELPPSPGCVDCGWVAGPDTTPGKPNVHDQCCPSMRGLLLGLRESCPACRTKVYSTAPNPTCEVHRARTLTCQREGCIPGPPRGSDAKYATPGDEFCERCGINMKAPPYPPIAA